MLNSYIDGNTGEWDLFIKLIETEFKEVAAPIKEELKRNYKSLVEESATQEEIESKLSKFLPRFASKLITAKNKEDLIENAKIMIFEPEKDKIYRKALVERDLELYMMVRNEPEFKAYTRRQHNPTRDDKKTYIRAKEDIEMIVEGTWSLAFNPNVSFTRDGRTLFKDDNGLYWMPYDQAHPEVEVTMWGMQQVDEQGNSVPDVTDENGKIDYSATRMFT